MIGGANGSGGKGGNGNGNNGSGGGEGRYLFRLLNDTSGWRDVKPVIHVGEGVIVRVREANGLKVLTAGGLELRVGLDIFVTNSEDLNRLRKLVGREPASRQSRKKEPLRRTHFTGCHGR